MSSGNPHLPVFIRDLAVLLVTAGVTSILFRWLKQPVILGYLVAGLLVGPHFSVFPTVTDMANVKLWGEIGVLFVLFSLGLEFSFHRLLRIGGTAAVTAVVETMLMFAFGAGAALCLGWRELDALFWGGILCISSTSIVLKVFDENGFKSRHFAQLVMGVLIVEDLVAILLLVLLSTLALTRQVSGEELLWASGRLGFFMTLWFVVGMFVLPALVRRIRPLLTEETTLIVAVGLCLLMVLLSTQAGFSPALGAYVMGSLLAETAEGGRIEKLLHPLRNFFVAIFFVSVGMLFDPNALSATWPYVLLMSLLVVVGKTLAVTMGALASGRPLNSALRAGLSLTQIGEFSFIIAGLGVTMKVTGPDLYPMAIAVCIVTSFTSPYLIRASGAIAEFVERRAPAGVVRGLALYQEAVQRQKGTPFFPLMWRAYGPLVLINLVLLLAGSWVVRFEVYPRLAEPYAESHWVRAAAVVASLLAVFPFLYGLGFRKPRGVWRDQLERFPRYRWTFAVMAVARGVMAALVALVIIGQYVSLRTVSGIVLGAVGILGFVFYRYGGRMYRDLEGRYLGELGGPKTRKAADPVLPWDQHLSELVVGSDSPLVGMTLGQIGPQESFGVMVAAIDRGQRRLLAPKASDQVFPGDRLQVLGSDEGMDRIRRLAELNEPPVVDERPLRLQSVLLTERSPLVGLALRDSNLRDRVDGLLVGVEREGFRQLHPPADLRLETGDRLWIVGDPDKIHRVNEG